jgi:hypothetical protein
VHNVQSVGEQDERPFTTLWHGAREVLRSPSYYEMKNRAGVVGQQGLGPLLGGFAPRAGHTVRVHLMGHSFGARLVSFALAGLPAAMTGAASPVKSLTPIQGAFSHFAFAQKVPIAASARCGRAGASVPVSPIRVQHARCSWPGTGSTA